jgi:hypothetical protein
VRVLFLQQQPSPRGRKLAAGLRALLGDGEVELVTVEDGAEPREAIAEAISEFGPDLIHSFNPPDTLTLVAHELVGDRVPVVHDVEQLTTLRASPLANGAERASERLAVESSAAVVAASGELLSELRLRFRVPAQTLIFPSYALKRDLPRLLPFTEGRRGNPPRIAYAGTLATDGGRYDLRHTFRELLDTGASIDLFPRHPAPEYAALAEATPALTLHETLDPPALMRALPRYDFGWAGLNDDRDRPHADVTLPSKLFDYLGAGLPVLTLPHRAQKRFLRERGLGIVLECATSLPGELERRDVEKLHRRVAAARYAITVEGNAERLLELYERVLAEPAELAPRRVARSRVPSG